MAYISVVKPKGIIEDVLVKVGKFIFLVDFVVVNMEEDKHVHVLLRRTFLAIGAALIEVKKMRADFESCGGGSEIQLKSKSEAT